MASTEETSVVERHLEKGVLGIAVLILLVVAGFWVIRSPRVISIGDRACSPSEVDDALAQLGKEVAERHDKAAAPSEPTINWVEELKKRLAVRPMPNFLALGPEQPPLPTENKSGPGPTIAKLELAELAKDLVAPEKPLVAIERELVVVPVPPPATPLDTPPAQPGKNYEDWLIAHVVAVVDFGKTYNAWALKLAPLNRTPRMIAAAVELERAELRPDGKVGPAQPVSWTPLTPPQPKLPELDRNLAEVQAALEELARNQEPILRPDSYDVITNLGEESWRRYKPRSRLDTTPPPVGAIPPTPMPMPAAMPPAGVAQPRVPPPARIEAPAYRPGAGPGPRAGYESGLPDEAFMGRPRPGMNPRIPTPAPRPTPMPAPRPAPTAVSMPAMQPAILPTEQGFMEIWAHDRGLQDGPRCVYRARVHWANPLLTMTDVVKKPEDARTPTLPGPWSAWSDPMAPARVTEYFLVGASPNLGKVMIDVFTRKFGVCRTERLTVAPGEPIGNKKELQLPAPDGKLVSTALDFRTGSTLVDIDFNKKVQLAGTGLTKDTTEAIVLDNDGRLVIRLESVDRACDRYKQLADEAKQGAGAPAAMAPRNP